ncbi:Uncharacterised protein [Mycobacteroides abscessus subsp. abscessus]|nr:Uncharacterised protein [Mycobacteroides abscessus subsp. abscessus]
MPAIQVAYWAMKPRSRPRSCRIAANCSGVASGPASADSGPPGINRTIAKISTEATNSTRIAVGMRRNRYPVIRSSVLAC